MPTRRTLLVAAASTGTITALAGCSGGESSSEPQEESSEPISEEQEEGEEESEPSGLSNFSVEDINFTYGFSEGLNTTVVLRNQTEDGSGINTANVSVEAFNEDTSLGEVNKWQDIQAELTREFDLTIESLSELSDSTLEDLTELRIRGKEEDREYVELNTFSGETVRSRIEE